MDSQPRRNNIYQLSSRISMTSIELQDFKQDLPNQMPVSVIIEKRPSDHPWLDFSFQAVGVVAAATGMAGEPRRIHAEQGVERFLVAGLTLRLYPDQCESYYHNLMSPQPGCFIVAHQPDNSGDMPRPYLVSLSFDEVHAYLEGDELVYAVPIPPELYKWSEAYVLTQYVAVKKTKRRLTDWRQQAPGLVLHTDSSS